MALFPPGPFEVLLCQPVVTAGCLLLFVIHGGRSLDISSDKRLNVLSRNLIYKCGQFLGRGEQKLIDNLVTENPPDFIDEKNENFLLREDSWVYSKILGFQKIPFDRIGLFIDEYRKALPTNK